MNLPGKNLSSLFAARLTIITMLVAATVLLLAPGMLFAQSADDSGGSVASPAFSSSTEEVSSPRAGEWDRTAADAPDSDSQDGQVLEVPQVIDPADTDAVQNAATADDTGPSQSTEADASSDGSEGVPDGVGSLDDYQNQEAAIAVTGPYGVIAIPTVGAPPTAVGAVGIPMGPRATGIFPPGPIMIRPGGVSPIMPTSPMLTMPRSRLVPRGPVGFWTRAGRH